MAFPSCGQRRGYDEQDPSNWWNENLNEYIVVKKPQTAGSYTLKMTCDGNGGYTYTWEAI
jgi:hypothetical protein